MNPSPDNLDFSPTEFISLWEPWTECSSHPNVAQCSKRQSQLKLFFQLVMWVIKSIPSTTDLWPSTHFVTLPSNSTIIAIMKYLGLISRCALKYSYNNMLPASGSFHLWRHWLASISAQFHPHVLLPFYAICCQRNLDQCYVGQLSVKMYAHKVALFSPSYIHLSSKVWTTDIPHN